LDRSVTVRLGTFAAEALTEGHRNATAAAVVDERATAKGALKALRFYLNEESANAPGWAYPELFRGREPDARLELELKMDESLWRAAKLEARRQKITFTQLLEHAAMYYATELDAGHIAQRILHELDTPDRA